MYNILICYDESGIRAIVSKYARFEGHNVISRERYAGDRHLSQQRY